MSIIKSTLLGRLAAHGLKISESTARIIGSSR
jgi:hypothetical protein